MYIENPDKEKNLIKLQVAQNAAKQGNLSQHFNTFNVLIVSQSVSQC